MKGAWSCILVSLFASTIVIGGELADQQPGQDDAAAELVVGDPKLGYELLTTKAYLPPVFTQANMDEIWRAWPGPLRRLAEKADAETRRRLIFERYGFTERVRFGTGKADGSGKPLQYVVDEMGQWSMNCFACHGGTVRGSSYPGAPNNRFAFELLAKEMRTSKLLRGIAPNAFDVGSMLMPLGRTRGTTNAIMFGVGLMHYRDEDLNLKRGLLPPAFSHHDVDAPPWWHFSKKPRLYIDGFAQKGHRGLMQFVMVEENSGETLRGWEQDFKHIYAYLESVKAPEYPYELDMELAKEGAVLFQDHCAECHGSYCTPASPDQAEDYPSYRVALDEIGTDPVRLEVLNSERRSKYARSWLAHYGQQDTETDPDTYVAPPLDGIWASPPYFHNGSVPTLWDVLNPAQRPTIWKHRLRLDGQADVNLDLKRMGIQYTRLSPEETTVDPRSPDIFDTRQFGKSNRGHDFPDQLDREEKRSVLEYLKTL